MYPLEPFGKEREQGQLPSRVAAGTMKATQIRRTCKLDFEQRVRREMKLEYSKRV
jgi:hypothetical protein